MAMYDPVRLRNAVERLRQHGFHIEPLGQNRYGVERYKLVVGSFSIVLYAAELLKAAETEPRTIKAPHGRKTHRAILAGGLFVTPCGEHWPSQKPPVVTDPVSCALCRERLGDTLPPGSHVVDSIRRIGDKVVALLNSKTASAETSEARPAVGTGRGTSDRPKPKRGMIRLERGQYGWDYVVVNCDTGETLLVTSDYDYPGLASTFGWIPCDCGDTDGTVDCEHKTASQMIQEAREYLDEHIGDEVEDPGYFS